MSKITLDSDTTTGYSFYGKKMGPYPFGYVGASQLAIPPQDFIFTFLSQLNSSSVLNMNLNATLTGLKQFQYTVGTTSNTDDVVHISRIVISLNETSNHPEDFGTIENGLTNGLEVRFLDTDSSQILSLIGNSQRVKKNYQFHWIGAEIDYQTGSTFTSMIATIDFCKMNRHVVLKQGQRFEIRIADDLSGLSAFHAVVQGYWVR